MANADRAKGLLPVRHINGSPWNGQTTTFLVDSSDGTAIYVGDVVKTEGTAGGAGKTVYGVDCEGMQRVIRVATGATGQDILGVVVGFSPDPTDLTKKHRAASTDRLAFVVTDPTVVYEIQEDAVTSNLAAADVGLNISFSTTAGSATTGISGIQAISNAKATTVTLPLKILGLAKRPDNAFGLASTDKAKIEVLFNTGLLMSNTVGA
jgi:hypothetical protein